MSHRPHVRGSCYESYRSSAWRKKAWDDLLLHLGVYLQKGKKTRKRNKNNSLNCKKTNKIKKINEDHYGKIKSFILSI